MKKQQVLPLFTLHVGMRSKAHLLPCIFPMHSDTHHPASLSIITHIHHPPPPPPPTPIQSKTLTFLEIFHHKTLVVTANSCAYKEDG
ncbi:hypothetical protein C5167_025096 [Papaver somniferum]|uniref:Uncharacterized protein n=1 Tax=Papaver somniferum TaxID=3469 RepID=A0A4Y7JU82_PAPSO|nr:hypothetical protein C5167_025096 [Papaver somniferum]